MYELTSVSADNKKEFYKELSSMLAGLIGDETDWLANAANAASLLYHMLPEINWAVFTCIKRQLVLAPLMGSPPASASKWEKGCAAQQHKPVKSR